MTLVAGYPYRAPFCSRGPTQPHFQGVFCCCFCFVCLVWFGFFFASKYGFFGLGPSPSRDPPPAGQKRGQPESRWQMAPASSSRLTVWTPRPALASPLWERDGRRGRAQRKRVQEPRSEKRRQRVRSGPEKRKKPDRWRQEDKI